MDVYVYQAALLCAECGEAVRRELGDEPPVYDSDDYPAGPFADGGGESYVPEHCDRCGVFLENPLTEVGVVYVLGELRAQMASAATLRPDSPLLDWAEHIRWYSYPGSLGVRLSDVLERWDAYLEGQD